MRGAIYLGVNAMRSKSVFRLATVAGMLTGVALLRDMFSSVNNRVNGFERHLKTGRYTGHGYLTGYNKKDGRAQYSGTRRGTTNFSGKQHGERERQRRLKQLNRAGLVSVTYVGEGKLKGQGALARSFDGDKVSVQMNDLNHPHSTGWHRYAAEKWAVGFHGRKPCGYNKDHGVHSSQLPAPREATPFDEAIKRFAPSTAREMGIP